MPYTIKILKSLTVNKMDCQINAIIILHSCPIWQLQLIYQRNILVTWKQRTPTYLPVGLHAPERLVQELTKSTWSCFTLQLIAESERVRNDQVNLVVSWAYDIRQMRREKHD